MALPQATDVPRTRRCLTALATVTIVVATLVFAACSSDAGPPPKETRTIDAGGVTWHAIVRGPSPAKAKRTVLFLHGASYTSKIWDDRKILDDVAAKGYRAVAVDLPGAGDTPSSDQPKADLLAALLAQLGGADQVVVVSPSASGAYSLALLADRPKVALGGYVGVAPAGIDGFHRPTDAPRVPALLVWGANDEVIPFAQAKVLAAQLPGSHTVRIPDATHAAYDDQPDAFVAVLLRFLADLPSA
ncbi:MAG: alpha/beta fold hydrolase [Acidimicrobiales bacterium]